MDPLHPLPPTPAAAAHSTHPEGHRVAVVGSRLFADLDRVKSFVATLPQGVVLVTGDARGVDRTALTTARARCLRFVEHRADWDRDGRFAAGRIRNQRIVDTCDHLVAFWDGASNGTHDTITRARHDRRPLTIYRLRLAPLIGKLARRPTLSMVDGSPCAAFDLEAQWPASGDGHIARTYRIVAAGDLATALARVEPGRHLRVRAALRQVFYTDATGCLRHRTPRIEARTWKFLPQERRPRR